MIRLIFIVSFLWFSLAAIGQGVEVPRSTDIVVIRGKSFYLHTVQPGQTLYSISKAYQVDVEELKKLNDRKDNNLSLYEVLKVPFVEAFVQQDDKYYYHRVAKGETLYSIARRYGMKIKRLLKHNEQFSHNEPVPVGAVVRLPLKEIDRSAIEAGPAPVLVEQVLPVSGGAKEEGLQQNLEKDGESVEAVADHAGQQSDLSQSPLPPSTDSWGNADKPITNEMPAYLSEVVMPAEPFVKIALLLPFSAREYPILTDSLLHRQTVSVSARDEQFLYFYEGILLAVDSLKHHGSKVKLHVYDTERSPEKMYLLAEELKLLRPDLIIGPVYASVYRVLAGQLQGNIPMVYPLSSRSENLSNYPNFIQVNASYTTLVSKMTEWIQEQRDSANIVQISLGAGETGMLDSPETRLFTQQMTELGINFFDWSASALPLDTLRTLLSPDQENILLLPTTKEADVSKVLPVLSALTDGYRITVVGFPEWQAFPSVDHETYYKLNTKLFTYSYVDHNSAQAQKLKDKFRKYFYTEPHSLVYKAYDMGLYFIDLADRYRDRTLEALQYQPKTGEFSRFRFLDNNNGGGKENHGFFIVNFGSDYQLKIETFR